MPPDQKPSLTQTTGRALRWNYIGVVTRMVLSFGINALLARLLGPGPYGELAVAMLVFGFGNLLANVGLGTALVQKQDLDEQDIRFCFTCQVGFGAILTALLLVFAPYFSAFFHEPHLTPILRVFSLLFLFQAGGTTASAILMRNHDARSMQGASVISYLVAYLGVGVPMALLGMGVWSLVAAWLVQALLNSALTYLRVRHSLIPLLHSRHLGMLTFGTRILAANICSWGISSLDNLLVGRTFGQVALGLYNRAFAFTNIGDAVTTSLMQVLLPAMSRVQDDKQKLRQVYASVLGLIVLILAPAFGAMAAAPDAVILGLYGHKWEGTIPLFQPLALTIPLYGALSIAGPLLAARGKPQREFYVQLIAVVIAIAAFATAVHWSLLALAWTVLGIYLLRFILLTDAANREIDGKWTDLTATTWPGLALALLTAAVTRSADALLPPLPDPIRLVIVLSSAAIAGLAGLAIFSETLLRPIFTRSPQLATLVPSAGRRFLPAELQ